MRGLSIGISLLTYRNVKETRKMRYFAIPVVTALIFGGATGERSRYYDSLAISNGFAV